jgi:hypothetical protein
MRFYDVPVNRSVPTEANRGLTSYMLKCWNSMSVSAMTLMLVGGRGLLELVKGTGCILHVADCWLQVAGCVNTIGIICLLQFNLFYALAV